MRVGTVDALREAFAASGATIAYVGNSANYGVGPELFLPEYHFACLDYSPLVDALRENGRSVFCLEEELGKQNSLFRSTAHLLENELAVDFLRQIKATHLQLFKASAQIEASAESNGWHILSVPAALGQGLENKFRLEEIASTARVATPRSLLFEADAADFDRLAFELGMPFVVQAAKGFAGNKTFLVGSKGDLERVLVESRSSVLKGSKIVSGTPVTVNACVTSRGTVVGLPVYQITGVPECTGNPLGSCGNDFVFGGIAGRLRDINAMVKGIGAALGGRGYRGIFGVDIVIAYRALVLIEVNPRTTASLPLHTVLQIEREELPLMALHLAEFLGVELGFDAEELTSLAQRPIPAASVILYNTKTMPVVVGGELKAGVYRLAPGGLEFLRSGVSVADCLSSEEAFLSPAARGKHVNPGIEYARIYFKRGVLAAPQAFHPEVSEFIKAVKGALIG